MKAIRIEATRSGECIGYVLALVFNRLAVVSEIVHSKDGDHLEDTAMVNIAELLSAIADVDKVIVISNNTLFQAALIDEGFHGEQLEVLAWTNIHSV